jgi:tape measure domain-containing protein
MAEQLQIEIDVSAAKNALTEFSNSFTAIKANVDQTVSGLSETMNKFNASMTQLKGIDAAVSASISTLAEKMSALTNTDISNAVNSITKLNTITTGEVTKGIEGVSKALGELKTDNVEKVAKEMDNLNKSNPAAAAKSVEQLAVELQKLTADRLSPVSAAIKVITVDSTTANERIIQLSQAFVNVKSDNIADAAANMIKLVNTNPNALAKDIQILGADVKSLDASKISTLFAEMEKLGKTHPEQTAKYIEFLQAAIAKVHPQGLIAVGKSLEEIAKQNPSATAANVDKLSTATKNVQAKPITDVGAAIKALNDLKTDGAVASVNNLLNSFKSFKDVLENLRNNFATMTTVATQAFVNIGTEVGRVILNLETAARNVIAFGGAAQGLAVIAENVKKITEVLREIGNQADKATTSVVKLMLSLDVKTPSESLKQVADRIRELEAKAKAAVVESKQLEDKLKAIAQTNVQGAANGVKAVGDAANNATAGANKLTTGIKDAEAATRALANGTPAISGVGAAATSSATATSTWAASLGSISPHLQAITVGFQAAFGEIVNKLKGAATSSGALKDGMLSLDSAAGNLGAKAASLVMQFSAATREMQGFSGINNVLQGDVRKSEIDIDKFSKSLFSIRGAAAAVAAVGIAFTTIIAPIIEVSDKIRAFKGLMETIGGPGAGERVYGSLKKTANEFGIELGALTEGAKKLIPSMQASGRSVDDANKVVANMSKGLKGLGAGNKEVEGTFRALGQVYAKGKVELEEVNQIAEHFPGALNLMAQAMNLSVESFKKLTGEGRLMADSLVPAFAKLAATKYGDNVVAQSQTASSELNRLKNAWHALMAAFGDGNFGGLLGGVAKAIGAVTAAMNSPALAFFVKGISDIVGAIIGLVGNTLAQMITGFNHVFTAISAVPSAIVALVSAFASLETAQSIIKFLGEVLKGMGQVILDVWNYMGSFVTRAIEWVKSFEFGRVAIDALSAAFKPFGDLLSSVADTFVKSTGSTNAFTLVFNLLLQTVGAAAAVWAAYSAGMIAATVAKTAHTTVMGLLTTAKTAYSVVLAATTGSQIANTVATAASTVATVANNVATTAGSGILAKVAESYKALMAGTIGQTAAQAALTIATNAGTSAKDALFAVGSKIKEMYAALGTAAVTSGTAIAGTTVATTAASFSFAALGAAIKGATASMLAFLATPIGAALAAIAVGILAVVTNFQGLGDAVSKAAGATVEFITGEEKAKRVLTDNTSVAKLLTQEFEKMQKVMSDTKSGEFQVMKDRLIDAGIAATSYEDKVIAGAKSLERINSQLKEMTLEEKLAREALAAGNREISVKNEAIKKLNTSYSESAKLSQLSKKASEEELTNIKNQLSAYSKAEESKKAQITSQSALNNAKDKGAQAARGLADAHLKGADAKDSAATASRNLAGAGDGAVKSAHAASDAYNAYKDKLANTHPFLVKNREETVKLSDIQKKYSDTLISGVDSASKATEAQRKTSEETKKFGDDTAAAGVKVNELVKAASPLGDAMKTAGDSTKGAADNIKALKGDTSQVVEVLAGAGKGAHLLGEEFSGLTSKGRGYKQIGKEIEVATKELESAQSKSFATFRSGGELMNDAKSKIYAYNQEQKNTVGFVNASKEAGIALNNIRAKEVEGYIEVNAAAGEYAAKADAMNAKATTANAARASEIDKAKTKLEELRKEQDDLITSEDKASAAARQNGTAVAEYASKMDKKLEALKSVRAEVDNSVGAEDRLAKAFGESGNKIGEIATKSADYVNGLLKGGQAAADAAVAQDKFNEAFNQSGEFFQDFETLAGQAATAADKLGTSLTTSGTTSATAAEKIVTSTKNLAAGFDAAGNTIDLYADKNQKATEIMTKYGPVTISSKEAIDKLSEAQKQNVAVLDQANTAMNNNAGVLLKAEEAHRKVAEGARESEKAMGLGTTTAVSYGDKLKLAAEGSDKLNTANKLLVDTVKDIKTATDNTNTALAQSATDLDKIEKGVINSAAAEAKMKTALLDSVSARRSLTAEEEKALTAAKNTIATSESMAAGIAKVDDKTKTAASSIQTLGQRLSEYVGWGKKVTNANSEAAGATDKAKESADALGTSISNQATAAQNAAKIHAEFGEAVRSVAANQDTNKESLQRSKAVLQEYGVEMGTLGIAMAKHLQDMGIGKTQAIALASAYDEAKKSSGTLAEEQKKVSETGVNVIKTQAEIVQALQERIDKVNKLVETGKISQETADKMNQSDRKSAKSAQDLSKETYNTMVATKMLYEIRENGLYTDEAMKKAMDDVASKIGLSTEKAKELGKTFDQNKGINGDYTKSVDSTKTAQENLAKEMAKTGENADKAAENIKNTAEAVKTNGKHVAEGADSYGKLNKAVGDIDENLTKLKNGLGSIDTSLRNSAENSDKFINVLVRLPESLKTLEEPITTVLPLLSKASEALGLMATNVEKLPEAIPGIIKTLEELLKFATEMEKIKTAAESTKTAFDGFATASDNVATSFGKMTEASTGMRSEMDNLISKLGEVVTKMNDVKSAAESALNAAKAAASAAPSQGGGGGGGDSPDANPKRDGGYASPKGSAFEAAPKFADGIANTSSIQSTMADGGIPSILHPNEAVVPLPKGRSIPVELKYPKDLAPAANAGTNLNKQADIMPAVDKLAVSVASAAKAMVDSSESTIKSSEAATNSSDKVSKAVADSAASAAKMTISPNSVSGQNLTPNFDPSLMNSRPTGMTLGPNAVSGQNLIPNFDPSLMNGSNPIVEAMKIKPTGMTSGPHLTNGPQGGYNPFDMSGQKGKDADLADKIAKLMASIPAMPSMNPTPATGGNSIPTEKPRVPTVGQIDAAALNNRGGATNLGVNPNPSSVNYNRNETSHNNNSKSSTVVNMVVNATDADSFKRSEDQIVRRYQDKVERVNRQNGAR